MTTVGNHEVSSGWHFKPTTTGMCVSARRLLGPVLNAGLWGRAMVPLRRSASCMGLGMWRSRAAACAALVLALSAWAMHCIAAANLKLPCQMLPLSYQHLLHSLAC